MTRWDWKSIVGYIPLATSLYTPKNLRKRAEYVRGLPGMESNPGGPLRYAKFLEEVAKRVEDETMTPWEAQQFVHEQRKEWRIKWGLK